MKNPYDNCPMCSSDLKGQDASCPSGCPMGGKRCGMIRCGQCGYEMPKPSTLVRFVSKFLSLEPAHVTG